ncbi:MAG: polymer-forming cytoskeletal protein [Zetaproteobacteria bacterium]|nr:MAG: polymer-forming cytoskeletal protein [Zetaproteobacteria bacterium]
MALFTQTPRKDDPGAQPEPKTSVPQDFPTPTPQTPTRRAEEPPKMSAPAKFPESILSSGLTIEGKIEGSGNVRVAGRFKGNVNVKGEFTVEQGASVHGEVRADSVLVGGEVRGQIVATSRVEFKETGTLIGDLKAGSLAVAAGSKMRGKVEFGWKEGEIEDAPPAESGGQPATR